jgi:hypothetical protein
MGGTGEYRTTLETIRVGVLIGLREGREAWLCEHLSGEEPFQVHLAGPRGGPIPSGPSQE